MRVLTIMLIAVAITPAFSAMAAPPEESSNHERKDVKPLYTLDMTPWGGEMYYIVKETDGSLVVWEEGNRVKALQSRPFISYGKAFAADSLVLA